MTNASNIQRPPSEPLADGRPTTNGAASFTDRVRSLRLAGRGSSGRSKNSLIPWGLSAILLLTALGLGYRTYRAGPPGGEDPGRGFNPASSCSASTWSGTASANA